MRTEPGRLPLLTLLSQALVAFTIEFDNEAEHQLPHRTSRHGATAGGGVWLVSMVMWLNCMRYVSAEPMTVADLVRRARTPTNLDGMRRWGYIRLAPDPAGRRSRPSDRDLLVSATTKGLAAQQVWQPLTATIEARWRERHGAGPIGGLTEALRVLAGPLGGGLPDCLPILGPGLYGRDAGPSVRRAHGRQPGEDGRAAEADAAADVSGLALPWLLSRVLLAGANEFEQDSPVSLAVAADLLRVLHQDGIRVRDLPERSGVSAEGLAMATGLTGKRKLTVIESGADGQRWKMIRLTDQGAAVRQAGQDRITSIEAGWQARFGPDAIARLRAPLEQLAGGGGPDSPLWPGLQPYAGNWRASVRPPVTLPHYPMVLHRGGYPDGS
jgi:hypothetical protein